MNTEVRINVSIRTQSVPVTDRLRFSRVPHPTVVTVYLYRGSRGKERERENIHKSVSVCAVMLPAGASSHWEQHLYVRSDDFTIN